MRILHVIQSADPVKGGPIEGVRQFGLADNQNEHDVACIDPPHSGFINDFPLRLFTLGPGGKLGYSSRLVPWLRDHARNYHLIAIHGLWRYASFGSWRALRRLDVPYVVMPHGMLDPWFKHTYPFKHLKKWLFWPWTEYRVLRDAAAVIFTCEQERLLARDSFWLYRARERVVTYGTSGIRVDRETARNRFLSRYPDLKDKRCLLYLGRIHVKKGCDLLIEAFSAEAKKDTRLHLIMAGPCHDNLDTVLKQRAEMLGVGARITWTSMISGEEKWGAFCFAEAFILPSHQENFGIAVVEALSCGTPVLISDKVQIWREIRERGAGIVHDDTLAGTRALISSWLELDCTERKRMREAARPCFEEQFAVGNYVSRMNQICEEAVA